MSKYDTFLFRIRDNYRNIYIYIREGFSDTFYHTNYNTASQPSDEFHLSRPFHSSASSPIPQSRRNQSQHRLQTHLPSFFVSVSSTPPPPPLPSQPSPPLNPPPSLSTPFFVETHRHRRFWVRSTSAFPNPNTTVVQFRARFRLPDNCSISTGHRPINPLKRASLVVLIASTPLSLFDDPSIDDIDDPNDGDLGFRRRSTTAAAIQKSRCGILVVLFTLSD